MEESGVKTEGGEVIPPPPDSLGKKKEWSFSCKYLFNLLGSKTYEKKIKS